MDYGLIMAGVFILIIFITGCWFVRGLRGNKRPSANSRTRTAAAQETSISRVSAISAFWPGMMQLGAKSLSLGSALPTVPDASLPEAAAAPVAGEPVPVQQGVKLSSAELDVAAVQLVASQTRSCEVASAPSAAIGGAQPSCKPVTPSSVVTCDGAARTEDLRDARSTYAATVGMVWGWAANAKPDEAA